MKKCNNCETEFEGDVCPNCQTKTEEANDVAETPAEEAPLDTAPITEEKPEETVIKEERAKISLSRRITLMLPSALFVVFSVFLWLFYTMPIAVIRNTGLGNMFSMQAVYESEFSQLRYIMMGLAAACTLYAAVSAAVSYSALSKGKVTTVKHLSSVNYIGYVAVFACACVTAAKVNAVYASTGACLNLCIAFSVSFAVLTVACGVCDEFIWNKNFEESAEKTKKNRNAPFIVAIAVVLVAAISLSIALPVTSYNFFTSKVSVIDLGDDQKKVRSVLGEPDYDTNLPSISSVGSPMWAYVNPEAKQVIKDVAWLELYNKFLPAEERIDDVVSANNSSLENKVLSSLNKMIVVLFDSDKTVAGVVFYNGMDIKSLSALDFNFDKRITKTTVAPVFADIDWESYNFDIKIFYEDGSYVCKKQSAYNCVDQQGRLKLTFLDEVTGEYYVGYANKLDIEKSGQLRSNTKFQYKVLNGMAVITKYIGNAETVNVPDTIDGNEVVAIGANAFAGNQVITDVTINGAKTIKSGAFNGCSKLKDISLPNDLVTIEDNAFAYCSSLGSIAIPSSVETIGIAAFARCTALTSVYGDTTGNLKTIGSSAFSYCTSLKSITIPYNVSKIGENALLGSGVTDVYFYNYSGWKAQKGSGSITLNSMELSPTYSSRAAKYLTEDYVSYEWINTSLTKGNDETNTPTE